MSQIYGLIFLILLAISACLMNMFSGNAQISAWEFVHAVFSQQDSLAQAILFRIRIPEMLNAFTVGGLLALSGSLMQVLLRNPLADPYILGVSGGAALGTLGLMTLGLSGSILMLGGWIGSIVAIGLVFALTRGRWDNAQLVLTGIAIATGLSALITLLVLLSSDNNLRGLLFWLVGDLHSYQPPYPAMIILLFRLACSLVMARKLNLVARGTKTAQSLGIDTRALQIKLFLLGSLLTATAVTIAGCIGFIGLIVPHCFRLMYGNDHRFLLPGSVLIGGTLLVLADFLAHHLFMPRELPVGIMMTLLGIPIFIYLLHRQRHRLC